MTFALRLVLCLTLLILVWLGAPQAEEVPPGLLKNLQYRVSLGFLNDVARVEVSLKPSGPGRYLAVFSGAGQGAWKLLSHWLPERYQTEMEFHQGRFRPLVYREELQIKGERVVKEYRVDYRQGRLAYWRQAGKRASEKRWEIPLSGEVYDPLTLIYNLRLGAWGPLLPGETLRVAGIPTPDPEDIVIHIGPGSGRKRKIMFTVQEKATGNERGPFFADLGPEGTPTLAWTRVLSVGKLTGELLPGP